jgi:hypothetical protein
MTLNVPIGISDFRDLRPVPAAEEVWQIAEPVDAALLPRAERRGPDTLFEGLAVMRDYAEVCRPHFQRYPVIYVRFTSRCVSSRSTQRR